MTELIEFITEGSGGNIASVLGLLVSLIGFVITIKNVQNSKTAADQARDAVLKVRSDMQSINTVSDLSTAISIMEEIKILHREKSWAILQGRYATLKRLLISVKGANMVFSAEHKTWIQTAMQQITRIDKEVEKALAKGEIPSNIPKFNEIVSQQVDNLGEILTGIRANIGLNDYDR